ncbi:helix-turn-helix domain-containing protein [Bacillus velezensis]|uniref:helix-turn-helix domain-containing protein n=1 Tax=Bacillus TaxID=1386 RepID=UPI001EFBAFF5|nr:MULTISPECIES: helix-turn-helix domain-containing protein [Bacillus]MCE4148980.1 helix-turn-helix domain-containing protein [Bacillus velezensis]MDV9183967.1 helix-turn-helix domain-containing protein [Bacillus sp. 31]MEC3613165.1 helix-turn-helix domain-containing protein [Bacillus velezensis]MEC3677774.1 helix-turn-helix domain-containing protein [Bacillus velezensis]ULN61982.1 helix-turn-helix domain-containing protein [Bacillus velezensis]
MEYHLKCRQDVEDFVVSEILSTPEVAKILDVNKQRMSKLIKDGRIAMVKKVGTSSLFLRQDVENLKKELEANKKFRPFEVK